MFATVWQEIISDVFQSLPIILDLLLLLCTQFHNMRIGPARLVLSSNEVGLIRHLVVVDSIFKSVNFEV